MKKFLIIGHQNAITYKEIFPLIKDDKIWIGYKFNGKPMEFIVPDDYELKGNVNGYLPDGRKYIGVGGTCWFTNLDIPKRHEDLILVEKYSPEKYPKYDNYDAINVDKTADIPEDYVPCWFACPLAADCKYAQQKGMEAAVEGCCTKKKRYIRLYKRIVIHRKKVQWNHGGTHHLPRQIQPRAIRNHWSN